MNRGRIIPQPQIGISYLDPNTPSPPAPPFPPPLGSTLYPLFVAAGAAMVAYFPSPPAPSRQTWRTIMIPAVA